MTHLALQTKLRTVSSLTSRGSRCVAASAAAHVTPSLLESTTTTTSETSAPVVFGSEVMMSGLKGKALQVKQFPTKAEVLAAIPAHCWEIDTTKSLLYAARSLGIWATCVYAGSFIPMTLSFTPAWILYALVTGTVMAGPWVIAHECNHGAFSKNKLLQDIVGFVIHSTLIVPYFSWQRSHAVHHAFTNHLSIGESHVPDAVSNDPQYYAVGEERLAEREDSFGKGPLWIAGFAFNRLWTKLIFGWPAYITLGFTGGPVRGTTNHFIPQLGNQEQHSLFPGKWATKVWQSNIGVAAFLAIIGVFGATYGSLPVALLYFAPLAVCNVWLVLYTWLQHTDVDVPHFGTGDWTWSKGTFMTIDRPYGPILNMLHHGIGATHVAHHIDHTIPHYNAWEATEAIKKAFPDIYLYDPTPIHEAIWRIGKHCVAVEKKPGPMGAWVFNTSLKSVAK